jgi:hypothetical protein
LCSSKFFGEADEKPSRRADVAEPVRSLILDNFAHQLRAAIAEPFKRLVEVVHGEHDAEVAERVDRGVAVICDDRRREEAGELEPAVAVRCAHHGNLDMLIAQSGDASGPFSFDGGPPFELEAEFAKEIKRPFEVIDDDSYVVQSFERHASTLQVRSDFKHGPIRKPEARRDVAPERSLPNSTTRGGLRAIRQLRSQVR